MVNTSARLGLIAFALALAVAPRTASAGRPEKLTCDSLIGWFSSDNYGWWWGALGRCKQNPGGPTDPEAIFDCAYRQIDKDLQDPQWDCLKTHLRKAPNTRIGIDYVAAFNGKPTCDWLYKKYGQNDYRLWRQALATRRIGPPLGAVDPNVVFAEAVHTFPLEDQQTCLRDFLDLEGTPTAALVDDIVEFNQPPGCPTLVNAYKQNGYVMWWIALGAQKVSSGGESNHDKIIDTAILALPLPDRDNTCLTNHLKNLSETERVVAEVRMNNGVPDSVADHIASENFDEQENCELDKTGKLGSDFFAPKVPFPEFFEGGQVAAGNWIGQNIGSDEGRLSSDFRRVAQLADPIGCALPAAAAMYAESVATGTVDKRIEAKAQAYADLAVTGTKAFEKFRTWQEGTTSGPKEGYCSGIELQPRTPGCPLGALPTDPEAWRAGCRRALDRAYRVANFLRTGQALRVGGAWFEHVPGPDGKVDPNDMGTFTPAAQVEATRKMDERNALGWIAVSGEDDAPHRPVNVPSSIYPQFNVTVELPTPLQKFGLEAKTYSSLAINARYTIAQSNGPALAVQNYDPKTDAWRIVPDAVPEIPPGSEILLFIHGMDSRAEEASDITKQLFLRVLENKERPVKRNLVIITVDLPSSGYTEAIDYDRISPLQLIGSPLGDEDFSATGLTPLLDALENFVVKFVDTLPSSLNVKAQMVAVMGGSLGGNLTFRLGRRANTPWIRNVVVWSPASIWTSLGEGNDQLQHAGPLRTWRKADDRNASDPDDLGAARLGRRRDFFVSSWDKPIIGAVVTKSQPQSWTSESWPCHNAAIASARLERHETYSPKFLTWRWRLAAEQLLYSHQTFEQATGQRRFFRNDKRMFLSCGYEDDIFGNEICDATRLTADHMKLTPGLARYLNYTGHSLDAERPVYFAEQVDLFLGLQ